MLHIQVDGRPPATGPGRFGVPLEHVSVMRPGGALRLTVDPDNPAVVAVDW
jgi:hypothetical protein